MENELKILLQSTKHIIFNTPKPKLEHVDEKHLFLIAKENGLAPFLYETYKNEKVSNPFEKALKSQYFAFFQRNSLHEQTVERIRKCFNENGIDFIFLKGVHLKHLYPSAHLRASGDIDVLLRGEKNVKAVENLLIDAGFSLTQKNPQHDLYTDQNGSYIEIHPTVYKAFNEKYDDLFENEWQYAEKLNNREYRFTKEYELCYLLYHLAKHFDASGVGLRSILDIGLYLKNYYSTINKLSLEKLLEIGQLKQFYETVVQLNQLYFNLAKEVLITNKLSSKRLSQLTQYIVTSGIHGKGKSFNQFVPKLVDQQYHKKNKIKLLLSIGFPKYATMKVIYPRLNKAPILLPFYWIHRLLGFFFKRFKSSLYKVKLLFSSQDKDVIETADMFKDIGL